MISTGAGLRHPGGRVHRVSDHLRVFHNTSVTYFRGRAQTGPPVIPTTCRPPASSRLAASMLDGVFRSPLLLRRAALVSLALNVLLVVTGGAVRLTGSGMGCPTWPRCTDSSYFARAALGFHGQIESNNRRLGVAVGIVAAMVVVLVLMQRS